MKKSLVFLLLFQCACAPSRFFYHPNKVLYVDPEAHGFEFDMVQYPSLNGKNLFGLLLRTPGQPKGTIIHFHGNFGNVSNHFPMSAFLVKRGFDVFIFDYQGYGGSEGKPSPKRSVEDGIATLRYVKANNRAPSGKIGVFGHSLGGSVAIVSLAKEPVADAVVIQAAFTSYRSEARYVLSRSFVGWLLYPFYPFLLSKRYDPIRYIKKLPPVPLFFVHGKDDKIVPVKMTRKLYKRAPSPKSMLIVPYAGHNNMVSVGGEKYQSAVSSFFTHAFESGN